MNEKPMRGEALLERRQRRADQVAAEDAVMHDALVRDGRKCRNPRCTFRGRNLPIDPCHLVQHRGMGGNPKGDRTLTTAQIISLCRGCHGLFDAFKLFIEPQTANWADDVCAFDGLNRNGNRVRLAVELAIGSRRWTR